ncbi:hypothetical protein CM19_13030 [Candidatus Acidianus copahuensis]|uniref:Uncharacterized protein n=1 Tax=Candidatus Acidianus copahuensis TaxID=1160895 RepID=A0A031LJ70_9CREN|nr:hypothetical protein [Candidatus Acidianus copahuensis]EZQ01535.1 hypothetical protein CM19_13030 [Candidatus Acidianus copahuensis]
MLHHAIGFDDVDEIKNCWKRMRNNSFLAHGGFVLYRKLSQEEKEMIINKLTNCWSSVKKEVMKHIDEKKAEGRLKEENYNT